MNGTINFDPNQFTVTTDATGSASFQIPVIVTNGGNSSVQVTATDYASGTQTINTQLSSSSSLSFALASSTPAGAPITLQFQPASAGISWSLVDASNNVIASGVSANDGSANSIIAVTNGSYTVMASQVGFQNANQAISVAGQTDPYTITLVANANPNSVQTGSNTGSSPSTSNPSSTTSTTSSTIPPSSEFIYPNTDYDKYFTITGARIYIGNLFIDELNMIQYALQDNAVPVYGYASRFYDALAQGRSLVQGQFALNFVSEGYLYTVMSDYATLEQSGAADQIINNPGVDVVAQVLGLMAARNNLTQQQNSNPNSLMPAGAPNTSTSGLQPGQLVQPTTVGTSAESASQATAVSQTSLATTYTNKIAALTKSMTPAQITQLNTQQQQALTTYSDVIGFANAVYQDVVFDIQIDFGNEVTGVKRVRYIEDCKLISNEQVLAPDGQTILDSYGFIARRLR
ncbi:MAG: hypothetical protein WA766_11690 [Candidatus Acidiferrales bacterium]